MGCGDRAGFTDADADAQQHELHETLGEPGQQGQAAPCDHRYGDNVASIEPNGEIGKGKPEDHVGGHEGRPGEEAKLGVRE